MPIAISDGPNLLAPRMGVTQPGSPPVLLNHPVQSTVAIDGWNSVLFGLPFLPAGVGIVCAALNTVHGSKNAPNWLIGLIGGGFFSAGAFLIVHGLRGAACQAVYQREAAEHPGEPWLADHHWRREGIPFSAFNAMLGRFVAALAWNAFLIPFFCVGLNVRGMGRVFLVFATIFALIGLVLWGRWLQMLGELLRHGNTFFAYDEFPYFLGQTFRGRLLGPHHVSALYELTFTILRPAEIVLPAAPAKTVPPASSAWNSTRTRSPSPATNSPASLAAKFPSSSSYPQISRRPSLPPLRPLTGRSRRRARSTAGPTSKPTSSFPSTIAPDILSVI